MTELSVTVTAGWGSEEHNHDIKYRSSLPNVLADPDNVIEMVPYVDYQEQINEIMKPYIEMKNQRTEERFRDAEKRYQAGEIKVKPSKKSFPMEDYDFAQKHRSRKIKNPRTGRMEEYPYIRSLIIGIGDRRDRWTGRITDDQARSIFREFIDKFRKNFPNLKILGASLHLDESGFYHIHIDYFPIMEKTNWKSGLPVCFGLDTVLENMGFMPEQSVMSCEEKSPLLFNALRNRIYSLVEQSMETQGLRLMYNATRIKEPSKDPSKNQRLEVWQANRDRVRELQHMKNLANEEFSKPDMTVDSLERARAVFQKIMDIVEGTESDCQLFWDKGYEVTKELLTRFQEAAKWLLDEKFREIQAVQNELNTVSKELRIVKSENESKIQWKHELERDIVKGQNTLEELGRGVRGKEVQLRELQAEIEERQRILTKDEVNYIQGQRGILGMIKVTNKDWIALKKTAVFAHDFAAKNQALERQIEEQNRVIKRIDREFYEIKELVKNKYPEDYQELIGLAAQLAQTSMEERRRVIEEHERRKKQETMEESLARIQKYRESHSSPSVKLREKKRTGELIKE